MVHFQKKNIFTNFLSLSLTSIFFLFFCSASLTLYTKEWQQQNTFSLNNFFEMIRDANKKMKFNKIAFVNSTKIKVRKFFTGCYMLYETVVYCNVSLLPHMLVGPLKHRTNLVSTQFYPKKKICSFHTFFRLAHNFVVVQSGHMISFYVVDLIAIVHLGIVLFCASDICKLFRTRENIWVSRNDRHLLLLSFRM